VRSACSFACRRRLWCLATYQGFVCVGSSAVDWQCSVRWRQQPAQAALDCIPSCEVRKLRLARIGCDASQDNSGAGQCSSVRGGHNRGHTETGNCSVLQSSSAWSWWSNRGDFDRLACVVQKRLWRCARVCSHSRGPSIAEWHAVGGAFYHARSLLGEVVPVPHVRCGRVGSMHSSAQVFASPGWTSAWWCACTERHGGLRRINKGVGWVGENVCQFANRCRRNGKSNSHIGDEDVKRSREEEDRGCQQTRRISSSSMGRSQIRGNVLDGSAVLRPLYRALRTQISGLFVRQHASSHTRTHWDWQCMLGRVPELSCRSTHMRAENILAEFQRLCSFGQVGRRCSFCATGSQRLRRSVQRRKIALS